MNTFQISTDAIGGSLGLSAAVATLPLIAFFIMLLGLKARAHTSGAVALIVALAIAIFGFDMPTGMALSSAARGGLFGLLPIVWVIITAIWFYEITVASGRFEDLRKTFDLLGDGDIRIQAILIAFCFGGLLEALMRLRRPSGDYRDDDSGAGCQAAQGCHDCTHRQHCTGCLRRGGYSSDHRR